MSHERALDFDDMQALLRFGHGHLTHSRFLLLSIADRDRAARWLQQAPVTPATRQERLPDEAVQLAFTTKGLQELGLSEAILAQFADVFLGGMSGDDSRSRRLGDVDSNAPEGWQWGHHDREQLHLLLLIYSREGHIDTVCDSLLNEDFENGFHILRELPTDPLQAIEPFGFIDGISQPAIDWKQSQRTDIHARESYSNLLAPGEIVLGYPDEYGQKGRRPLVSPEPDDPQALLPTAPDAPQHHDLGINGSYLVLRQLEQDVDAFWHYVNTCSGGDEAAAERLAASMVGRQRNGEPLIRQRNETIAGIAGSRLNAFDYDQDPDGQQCPIGAHVRRSNPRTGDFPAGTRSLWQRLWRMLGFGRRHPNEDLVASTRFHRLLRRGRTYGLSAPPGEPRGLHFICVGSNPVRQFEFVQSAWCVSSAFGGTPAERDPLIGHRQARKDGSSTADFRIPAEAGPTRRLKNLPQFVTVRGGAYFFLPGIRAIRYLAWCASQASTHATPGTSTPRSTSPRTSEKHNEGPGEQPYSTGDHS